MEYGEALDYAIRVQSDLDAITTEETRRRFLTFEASTPEYIEALGKVQEFITVMGLGNTGAEEAVNPVAVDSDLPLVGHQELAGSSDDKEVSLDEKIALLDKRIAQAMPERVKTAQELRAEEMADDMVGLLTQRPKDTGSRKRNRNPALQHERVVERKLASQLPELIHDPILFIQYASKVDELVPQNSGNVFRDKLGPLTERLIADYMHEHWQEVSHETLYEYTKLLTVFGDSNHMVTQVLRAYFDGPRVFEECIEPVYTYAEATLMYGMQDGTAVLDTFVDTLSARNSIISVSSRASLAVSLGPAYGMYDKEFFIKSSHVRCVLESMIQILGSKNADRRDVPEAERIQMARAITQQQARARERLASAGWTKDQIDSVSALTKEAWHSLEMPWQVKAVWDLQIAALESDEAVQAVIDRVRGSVGADLVDAFFFEPDPLVELCGQALGDVPQSMNELNPLGKTLGTYGVVPIPLPGNIIAEIRYKGLDRGTIDRVWLDDMIPRIAGELQANKEQIEQANRQINETEASGINYLYKRLPIDTPSINTAAETAIAVGTFRRRYKLDNVFLNPLSNLAYMPFPASESDQLGRSLATQAQEIIASPRGVNMRGIKFTFQEAELVNRGLKSVVFRRPSVEDSSRVRVSVEADTGPMEFMLDDFNLRLPTHDLLVHQDSALQFIHYLQKLVLMWANRPVVETSAGIIGEGEGDPVGGGFLRYLDLKADGSPKQFSELQEALCLKERRLVLADESRERAERDPAGRTSTYVRIFDATGMRWRPIEVTEPQPAL